MILTHRRYPFHAAVSVMQFGPECFIRVSTAKEGIFKGLSTFICVMPNQFAGAGETLVIGKILWADTLRAADRQVAHENLVSWLDTWLTMMQGDVPTLSVGQTSDAINLMGEKYREAGMLKEIIKPLRI